MKFPPLNPSPAFTLPSNHYWKKHALLISNEVCPFGERLAWIRSAKRLEIFLEKTTKVTESDRHWAFNSKIPSFYSYFMDLVLKIRYAILAENVEMETQNSINLFQLFLQHTNSVNYPTQSGVFFHFWPLCVKRSGKKSIFRFYVRNCSNFKWQ